MKRRNVDEYVVPSGVVQYFLPDLPAWANISESGGCKRKYSIRYFDFDKLKKSFSYSREQLISFQHMFNVERNKTLTDRKIKLLGFKEEENLFYKVSDNIQANVRVFRKPSFERIHLVWIDPFVSGRKKIQDLKNLFENKSFNQGFPVFVSQCLGYYEMENFIKKNSFSSSVRLVSSEFITPYDLDFKLSNSMQIHFNAIFNEKKNILFYTPEILPSVFKGKFKVVKF